MIRERAMELADALESGRYKRGGGALRWGACYCVMGVACDISGVGQWTTSGELADDAYTVSRLYSGSVSVTSFPPDSVRAHFDFCSCAGMRRDGSQLRFGNKSYGSLMDASDSGVSFKDLAAYIREHWEAL